VEKLASSIDANFHSTRANVEPTSTFCNKTTGLQAAELAANAAADLAEQVEGRVL
jgi:hypothetical protein